MTLKYLGDDRYGLWLSLSSILALMAFADFGLGNSLLNSISRSKGRSDIEDAKKAVSSTFFVLLAISIFLLILLNFTHQYLNLDYLLNLQLNSVRSEAKDTFVVLAVIILVNMPLGIIQRIYEGYQEGFTYQIFLLFGTLIGFLCLIIFIKLKLGLPELVLSLSMGNVIASLIGAVHLFMWKRKELLPRLKYFELDEAKNMMKTGGIFVLLQLFSFLNLTSDNIIIAHSIGTSSIPHFEIVKKLFSVSMMLVFFISPLWPAFAEAMVKKEFDWAKKTLYSMLKYCLILTALATLPLLLFGKFFIELWVGSSYMPSWFLLFGFYFFTLIANFGGIMASFFNSGMFLKKQLILVSIATISTLICKVLFINFLGIDWLIWANVICFSLFFILPSLNLTKKFFEKVLHN
jgi:O-antigen/teichoic acid export membrane protein